MIVTDAHSQRPLRSRSGTSSFSIESRHVGRSSPNGSADKTLPVSDLHKTISNPSVIQFLCITERP